MVFLANLGPPGPREPEFLQVAPGGNRLCSLFNRGGESLLVTKASWTWRKAEAEGYSNYANLGALYLQILRILGINISAVFELCSSRLFVS